MLDVFFDQKTTEKVTKKEVCVTYRLDKQAAIQKLFAPMPACDAPIRRAAQTQAEGFTYLAGVTGINVSERARA